MSIQFNMARSFQKIRAMGILLSLPALAVFGCSGRIELVEGVGGKGDAENSSAGVASLGGRGSTSESGGASGSLTQGNAGAFSVGGAIGNYGAAGTANHSGGTLG